MKLLKNLTNIESDIFREDGDMCTVFEEIREEGKLEGTELMAKLVAILLQQNWSEDVKKVTDDKEYRDKLLEEFTLV